MIASEWYVMNKLLCVIYIIHLMYLTSLGIQTTYQKHMALSLNLNRMMLFETSSIDINVLSSSLSLYTYTGTDLIPFDTGFLVQSLDW